MSDLKENYVRLLCLNCYHTLDFYWHTGDGTTFTPACRRKNLVLGAPNGSRVSYKCKKCPNTPVLLLARLLPLVPGAHREGKSILSNYLLT